MTIANQTTRLYHVESRADRLRRGDRIYKDVPLFFFVIKRPQRLFGDCGALGVPYSDAIHDHNGDNCYAEEALEEAFTMTEVCALCEWLKLHRNDDSATITELSLPIANDTAGFGALPVGGPCDFLMIGDAVDYDLPFKALAYFDVRDCESDRSIGASNDA
jgi:hypothetical protein